MNINIYAEIQAALKRGERLVVAIVIKTMGAAPCKIGSKILIRADGSALGSLAGPLTDSKVIQEALKAIRDQKSYVSHIHLNADQGEAVGSCGATLEIFFEFLQPEARLIIVGAGYVAQALTRLASRLDFRIIIIDDQQDQTDSQSLDHQIQQTIGNIPQTIRDLEPDETSWIVIVTRGHELDKEALKAALETSATYIGMIGSTSKVKQIFKDLLRQGLTREQLEKVHAPIGLDLGARTPDEIALSIAAEIVMLRNRASGAPLKKIHHLLDEEDQHFAHLHSK